MAAPMVGRGLFRIGLTHNSCVLGQHLRFYTKPLKRQAIRVLSIKEANDLAKCSRNSIQRKEIPKPNRSIPMAQGQYPARNLVQNSEKTNNVTRDLAQEDVNEKSFAAEGNGAQHVYQQTKVDHRQGGKASGKRKADAEWVTLPDNVRYEKLEAGDSRFGPMVMEAKLSKVRDRKSTILLEGKRLVDEAVAASLEMKTIFFTHIELLAGLPIESLVATGTKLYKISPKHMKVWSDTVAPSGLMAICTMPKIKILDESSRLPVTIICDRVKDAGSLGTVLRSAAAAGCTKVLVTRGNVDPWEPKVLRAGMGAHFHIPIISTGWEIVANYLTSSTDLYLVGTKEPFKEQDKLSKVPRSILQQVLVADNNMAANDNALGEQTVDESYLKRKELKVFEKLRLPIRSYETVNYIGNRETSIALVVGSNEGSSPEAKKFAFSRGGELLFVPGCCNLSQSITSSVILFEIRRQMRRRNNTDGSV